MNNAKFQAIAFVCRKKSKASGNGYKLFNDASNGWEIWCIPFRNGLYTSSKFIRKLK